MFPLFNLSVLINCGAVDFMAALSADPDEVFDFCFCCRLLELRVFTLTRAPPAGKMTRRKAEKGPTSRSILRAATELSSLKSIREDASVLRKLPSAKGEYTRVTATLHSSLRVCLKDRGTLA